METKTVEKAGKFVALNLGKIGQLTQAEINSVAADILARLEKDAKGGFVLPSGKGERKILAELVAEGLLNPRIGKLAVAIIAGGGVAAFLRPYVDRTGLFRSWKALETYRDAEAQREAKAENVRPCPVYVGA